MATAGAVVLGGLVLAPSAATADTAPVDTSTPKTVTTDALPTVQINGAAWDQVIVGDAVFAAGTFTTARPAGAAAGTQEVPRNNVLAYDLATGALLPFAPDVNGQINSIAASPDGTRLYIGGDFTTVDGQPRNRVAAFDLPAGNLVSAWAPSVNASVRGIIATNTTVYFTGNFGRVASNDRSRAAAVSSAGELLPWAPVLDNRGNDIIVSADEQKVALGGHFTTVNGSSNPGYGMALVDATNGGLLPFAANGIVRNAGEDSAIWSLTSDGTSLYGTGYTFGGGGNLEGIFKSDWATGGVTWVEDCHGDTYSAYATPDTVYGAGHAHYCESVVGGFPQSDPWTHYRGIAFENAVARTTPNGLALGYANWAGNPAPRMLHWYPTFDTGTVSGASQAAWSVTGNSDYVVMAGEFTRVNNQIQQGLVRFATTEKAPNTDGPRLSGSTWVPTATAVASGAVRVTWPLNWDRDNEYLEYKVIRDGVNGSPIHTTNARSKPADWGLPGMAFVDSGVDPGSTHTYRVRAEDAKGNVAWSTIVTATAGTSGTLGASSYSQAVLADRPVHYWPLNDAGSSSSDWAGSNNLAVRSGVTRGVDGALATSTIPASRFNGTTSGYASTETAVTGPQSFSAEAWFKTTTTAGGRILGFGNRSSGTSTSSDRAIYMDASGRLNFGIYPAERRVLTSANSYNDGGWHHVVATMDPIAGMTFYVDGLRVGQRTDSYSAQLYSGFWRVGGDATWTGAQYFSGTIDEVAIYGAPLTAAQVSRHFTAAGRTVGVQSPPADAYGSTVVKSDPTLYWRLAETTGTVVQDASGAGQRGTYVGANTKGQAGALQGVADSSVTFSGGQAISRTAFVNPVVYSTEAWFKTTSTSGGKIIGFGNSATGNSSSYDRHVYMTSAGQLVFGATNGGQVRLTSSDAYNNGQWHHVVATQGSSGMRLYVDGALVGENTNRVSGNYTGYWHVGGDVSWGPGGNTFLGTIDEVAVYPSVLPAATVTDHYSLGRDGVTVNKLPSASFASQASKLKVDVDGSASADPDGSIVSYDWNWGDGSAHGSGATASHTYAEAGTYSVTLTVTDDRAGAAEKTVSVVVVANVAPTAAFTSALSPLKIDVDGSTSSDSDGTIASYDWSWGDDSAHGTGATASHTYAAAGTYPVTLTVTDSDGATTTKTESVAISVGDGILASDVFDRTLASGLGTATTGGAWSLANSASNYAADGTGVFRLTSGGALRTAYLPGVSSASTEVTVDATFATVPVGGSVWAQALARRIGADDYRARVTVAASGAVSLQVLRSGTTLATQNLSGVTVTPGTTLTLRVEASGTNPTTIRAKAWKAGTAEPTDWQLNTTDATAALQAPGQVGLAAYAGSGVSNVPYLVRFDNLVAKIPGTVVPPPNVNPVASFTSSANALALSVDGSGSTDSDGSVTSWEWDFGDGEVGTGATAAHTYAAAGTYTVALKVTDDRAGAHTITNTVTVTAPEPEPVLPLVVDEFDRTGANGWGSAATGGAWSYSTTSLSAYSVDGAAAKIAVGAGSTRAAYLAAISSESTDLTSTMTVSQLPVGGSVFTSFMPRRVGGEDYRARVVVAANGSVQLQVQRTATTLTAVNVPGLTLAAGEELQVRVQAFGTNPTTIRAKVWKTGTTEPAAWQVSTTDTTAALQAPGHVGVAAYLGSGTTNVPYTVSLGSIRAVPVL
ncbi:PKD domain-containing protein [Microbacterium sp. APC 3901]|uniref:PKD domain-containing protein n=1 Tax=Microbacterium sp. APC 3901 TaxID=3035192 RepID=UPI0025B55FE7|nr:PKD domain-containing protein [Microbacterium sp. APC 3901]MDN3444170.1 PKD domain-containing protein [Microbacterium sp. APC 3901]